MRVPHAAEAAALDWKICNGGFECASLMVPLDYSNANGAQTKIALVRKPAGDKSKRIGSLLANPGGPGASGNDFVRAWAGVLRKDIRDRFDIVGFDPRGIGESDALVCHDNLKDYIAADPSPDNQAEFDTLSAVTKTFAEACAKAAGGAIQFYGTKNVARDLDRIREALGDAKLTYLGYSYGTVIGQVYAEMFPGNIRAMVLDGAVDLALDTDALSLTQAQGFELALQNFLADCKVRGIGCRLAKRGDPAAAIKQLLAQAEAAPIPSKSADRAAGPGEAILGILAPLYNELLWPRLDRIVDDALNGDGSGLVTSADDYLERQGNSYTNVTEMNLAVNCIDNEPSKLPATYKDYPASAARLAAVSPTFGPALATGLSCAFWKAKPDPLSAPTNVKGAPPIVVISTTGDPATPYQWGVDVSKQLANSVLLTYRGEGHTVYGGEDDCVDSAVNAYLISLTVPAAGTQCGNGKPPPAANAGTGTPVANATPGSNVQPRPSTGSGDDPSGHASQDESDETGSSSRGWLVFGGGVLVMFALAAAGTIWMAYRRR